MERELILNLKPSNLKGCSFASIKGYTNKQGETADLLINIGTSYENAVKADIDTLVGADLNAIPVTDLPTDVNNVILSQARTELVNSLTSPDANKSRGQTEAYANIGKGLRVHYDSGNLLIFGSLVKKTITTVGTYPTVNSRPKTKAKKFLKKYLDLRTAKYRQYLVKEITTYKRGGDTLEFGEE